MSSICGWMGIGADAGETAATVELMTAGAQPRTVAQLAESRTPAGLTAVVAGSRPARDGTLHAVIAGEPRWRSPRLAELAQRDGPARALLEAYRTAPADCTREISGTYALAVVDSHSRSALLAVDRMGTQPLAYAHVPGRGLVFATSSEAVNRHPWIRSPIDPQSIFNFVYFHMVPSPASIFAGVRKLGPGERLSLDGDRARVDRHWTPRFADGTPVPGPELAEEMRKALRSAVAPYAQESSIGAFLSGGLDSSTVAGMLRNAAGRPIPTFSMGFAEQGFDEMHYARVAARHFGTLAREYYVTPQDVAAELPRIAAAYDEPFGNSSAVPTFLCARFARQAGITRLLAGDGGDELFGGNERYATQKTLDVYNRLPAVLRERILAPFGLRSRALQWLWPARKLRSYVQQASVPMPERLQTWNFMYRTGAAAMFDGAFLRRVDLQDPVSLMSTTYAEAPTSSLVDRMLYFDWKFTLADNDLRKVGRMCELAGVQVAYPMLDDAVIDVSLRLTAQQKVHGLRLRHLYKQAFRGFLPDAIITKKKHGFGLPFGHWLKTSPALQNEVLPSLERLKSREILRPEFIDDLLRQFQSDPDAAYFGPMIWVLTMLEEWLHARRL